MGGVIPGGIGGNSSADQVGGLFDGSHSPNKQVRDEFNALADKVRQYAEAADRDQQQEIERIAQETSALMRRMGMGSLGAGGFRASITELEGALDALRMSASSPTDIQMIDQLQQLVNQANDLCG